MTHFYFRVLNFFVSFVLFVAIFSLRLGGSTENMSSQLKDVLAAAFIALCFLTWFLHAGILFTF